MPKLFILAGLPGSGKSTWAKNYYDLKARIVSSDDIRRRQFGSLTSANTAEDQQANNKWVFAEFHSQIELALVHGMDVIADATFLRSESRAEVAEIARRSCASAHLVLFKNWHEAVVRNIARDSDAVVPEAVMGEFIHRLWDTISEVDDEQYDSILKIESYA